MIKDIDEELVGRRVWFLDEREGVRNIVVTGVYTKAGRRGALQHGLWYDAPTKHGNMVSRILWLAGTPVFRSRERCENYFRGLLRISHSEGYMDKILYG